VKEDGKGLEVPPESDQVPATGVGLAASGPGALRVHPEQLDGVYRLRVSGELDLATGDTLRDELKRAEESEAKRIRLDLSALTFIDSDGLAILLEAHRRSATDGRRLTVLPGDDGQVRKMLELTGLIEVLDFSD